jgi:hypothetical protein
MVALGALGTAPCSNSSGFGPTSTLNRVTPVILPPGRFRLATSPICTGSAIVVKTMGIVAVAAFATFAAGVPKAAITATWRWIRSAARAGKLSYWPSAQRASMTTSRLSTYQRHSDPCEMPFQGASGTRRQTRYRGARLQAHLPAALAPQEAMRRPHCQVSVMNSRRFTVPPRCSQPERREFFDAGPSSRMSRVTSNTDEAARGASAH